MNATDHRDGIIERWTALARAKYDKGQAEHGGNLWEKPTLEAAIEESLDLPMYLFTLKDQIEEAKLFLAEAMDALETSSYDAAMEIMREAFEVLEYGRTLDDENGSGNWRVLGTKDEALSHHEEVSK